MDSSGYYAQASSSHYPNQYQGDGDHNRLSVVPVDQHNVQQYITALYRNPSLLVTPPTNDPAFFAKSQQDMLNAKHKLEQMLLINQQQAEIASMSRSAQVPYGHPQNFHGGANTSVQAYSHQQAVAHYHPAWTDPRQGAWMQSQQGYAQPAQPVPQTYTAHFSPEVEMVDLTQSVQPSPQITQLDVAPQHSLSYHQPTSSTQAAVSRPPPQRMNSLSTSHQSEPHWPQQPQAPPAATTSYVQNVFHPQPHRVAQAPRHHLQPGQSMSQAGSSGGQRDREQIATTQKQMQYLQQLERQHQRPPAQQQIPIPQAFPVSVPISLPLLPSAQVTNGAPQVQQAPPSSPVTQPTIVEVPTSAGQPPSTPRHNSSQQSNNSASGTDATPTSTPYPKIRARRPFSLHDLRSERRHSSGRSSSAARPRASNSGEASLSENAETSVVNDANQVSPPVPEEAQPSASQRDNVPDNIISTISKPPTPEQPSSLSNEMTVPPPEESEPSISLITSSSTSLDTPSTSVNPPPAISSDSVELVPASPVVQDSASDQAAVPVHSTSDPPAASPLPNASAPALNNPVQTQPAMPSHASTQPSTASSSSKPKPPAGSGTPMKMALELLHQKGVDCIAIVRQAAQMAGAPVELLQVPSTSTGDGQSSTIPLFAAGQPLDIWTQKLQVTRAQGDAIVKNIWDLAREKARELGLTGLGLKAQTATAASNGISGETQNQNADQPSNSGSSSTPVDSVAFVDRAQATSSPKPPTPVALQSSQPATAASTPPAMGTTQSSATPTPVPSHQSTPASKPSTPVPVPAPAQTGPAPVQSVPVSADIIAAPTVPAHMDAYPQAVARPPVQSQTQVTHHTPSVQELRQTYESLAQRHYYNPFPNGTPPPQPAQPQQQAYIPAYVPPNLSSQEQAPVGTPAPAQQASKPKPKNTAALDYLKSLGVTPDMQPVVGAAKKSKGKTVKADTVETSKVDKGKGKATDMEQAVERQSISQPEPLLQQSSVDNAVVTPVSAVVEPRAPESLQIPQHPARPSRPSPAAPEIAVLSEPSETPPSPLSTVDLPQPPTPITQEPADIAAPTPVPASPPVAPILDTPMRSPDHVSVSTPPPEPRLFPSPAPVPSYVQASVSPPARPATPPPATSTPRSVAPAQPASPAPAASTSTLAERSAPAAEHAPLKRKRKPVDAATASAILPPYYPLPDNSWAAMYSEVANQVAASQTSKRPRTTEPTPSTSTTKPLFRPETPTSDDEEWLQAPPTPKATSSGTNKGKGKQRMIMEVVIPIRKANAKGKAVAVPSAVRSTIDLTLDDRDETEGDSEQQIEDDDSEEEETDLQMLRRRLRPHTCEWVGCIGPPVLASAELLGVHLYKMHLNVQDPKTGYYMCRWDQCKLQFKNTKRLWTHISEAHVARPLYCPYQGCNRTASERHRMIVHVNRSHRENSEAELRPLARPTEFSPEQVVLRPSAFPPGVPYFRIMAMALRYEVLPARISAQRHARIGPIILRNISAPSGFVSVPLPGGGNSDRMPVPMPVFDSPVPVRAQVRLETLPPDVLGEELEREAGPPPVSPTRSRGRASRAPDNISPARSHITVHSDDSTPEPENATRGSISAGRIRAARGRGRGRGRGQGHESRSVRSEASSSPSSVRSAPAPGTAPRLHLVVELPSRTRAK